MRLDGSQGLDGSTNERDGKDEDDSRYFVTPLSKDETGVVLLSSKRWGGRLVLPPTSETNR